MELLFAHAMTDYALQTRPMAMGKNRHNKPDYVPKGQKIVRCWPYWMSAHALINGLGVYCVTQRMDLGIMEVISHFVIDVLKCDSCTNPHVDQFLHMLCKVFYCFIVFGY